MRSLLARSPVPFPRLRSARDIQAVFAARDVRRGSAVVAHRRLRDEAAPGRVAVVAGRKVGGAVARNRAKRRLRAAIAEVGVPDGVDLVLVARAAAVCVGYVALRDEVAQLAAPRVGASSR